MLELFLIRHGQTDYSRENRFCGSIDPPLNAVGERMADAFGAHYADRRWDAIYSSPSQRALRTANALAHRVGVTPTVEEGLREISYGEWETLRHEDALAQFPEAYRYWEADTASRATPGGETAFQVAARAAMVLEKIRAAFLADDPSKEQPRRVLIASHKATLRILACALLGMDVRLFRERIGQPVAAVSKFEITKRSSMLVMFGSTEHLPHDLRSLGGT